MKSEADARQALRAIIPELKVKAEALEQAKGTFRAAYAAYRQLTTRAQQLTNDANLQSARPQFAPLGGALFTEDLALGQDIVKFEREREQTLRKLVGDA